MNTQDNKGPTKADMRRKNRPTYIDPAQLYSIEEACAALDASSDKVYKLLGRGELVAVMGPAQRRVITGKEIIRYTSGLAPAGPDARKFGREKR
jgi:excisionase family DNA binding protein